MKYAKLGNTDIEVSRLCIGCMSFGEHIEGGHQWTLDQDATQEMVKHALELGINFFDTANTYAGGTSEEFLGRALKNVAKREDVRIATKVYFNEGHLKKEAIEREIDGSLKRLGTDYVDLYQIHRFDKDTPIEETMEALHKLVKAGKVRALGASAMYGYQFHNMQIAAEKNGWTPFSTMQNHYNLLYREDERELIPICQQMNVSLIPYSPLAAGRLSRLEWNTDTARSQSDKVAIGKYDSTQEQDYEIVKRVHEIAEKHNATMSQIAVAWHYAKGVTAPIVGATKPKYLDDAVGAQDIALSPEDVAALEEFYIPHKIVGACNMEAVGEALAVFLDGVVGVAIHCFELIGVIIIICAGVRGLIQYVRRDPSVRLQLAQGMALGLEFKLGSEILRTVVVRELSEVALVAAIIAVRAALTFLIHWEIKIEEGGKKGHEEEDH